MSHVAGAEIFTLEPIASTRGTIWSAKASARAPGDPEASSPSSEGCSPNDPSSASSRIARGRRPAPGPRPVEANDQLPPPKCVPRKVYFPVQARNEAAQWLGGRGAPPLLLKAPLDAYRELLCSDGSASCSLSDADLAVEILRRTEKL